MNAIDMRTIVVSNAAIMFVCTFLFLMLWLQNRARFRGIGLWSVGFALATAGLVMVALRGAVSDWFSVVLANVLNLASILMTLLGTEYFIGRQSRQAHNYVLLGGFLLLCTWYTFVDVNVVARVLLFSSVMLFYCGQCAWLLLVRVGRDARRWTFHTGLVYAALAILNVFRIVHIIVVPTASWLDFFQSDVFEVIAVFVYELLLILLTYTLTLMVNWRLLFDVKAQEEKFSKAFQSAPYMLTLTRLSDGLIHEVNDGFVRITGYAYDEAVGRTFPELELWANGSDRAALVEALRKTGSVRELEYPFRTRSGEIFLGMVSADVITVGGEGCILASISNVTERRRMEDALRESEEKFRNLAENSSDAIWHMDTSFRFTYISPADEWMRGFRQDEVIGTTIWSLLKPEGIEHVRRVNAGLRHAGRDGADDGSVRYEVEQKCKDGSWLWTEVNVVPHRDRGGNLLGHYGVTRDISERKRAAERIEHMARHDTLTDLPNRRLFSDLLETALVMSRRNETRLALMFVDLDRFKPVNDTYGHAVGDVLLREAARRMRSSVRASDTVGRIGGDEFVVLLPVIGNENDALYVAEKLRAALAKPFGIEGLRIDVSCSIGIAIAPDDGRDEIELAKNADSAMYIAKQQGGDAVRLFGGTGPSGKDG